MRFESIALRDEPPLATIEWGAALDVLTLAGIERVAETLRDRDDVHVLMLGCGAGAFAGRVPDADLASDSFRYVELLPQPVIAVIDGDCSGVGLELALACDLRVASESSTFSIGAVGEGGMPSHGGTQRLPRIVGRGRATAMILLGERLDAAAALAGGLVNAVAPAGETAATAEGLARSIAKRGPLAVRYAKEAIVRGLDMPLEQALRYETDLTVILQTTGDRAEGVRAFLEKRPPSFEGR